MKLPRLFYVLMLLSATCHQAAAQGVAGPAASACKTHSPASLPPPGATPILSTIEVPDAFQLASVAIKNLNLAAPRVGALKITLSAGTPFGAPPTTVILKDARAGAEATALVNTSFDDNADSLLPEDATGAPFTDTYMPEEMLYTFTLGDGSSNATGSGGSQGTWVLRVVDLKDASHVVTLNSWELELCAEAPPPAAAGTEAATTTIAPAPTTESVAPAASEPAIIQPAPAAAETQPTATTTAANRQALLPATTTPDANTSAEDPQSLLDLLDQLNSLSGNSTAGDTTQGTQPTSLLQLLSTRLDELLSPLNETRLARGITAMQNMSSNGGLGSLINTNQSVVEQFASAFRDLVSLAAGVNSSQPINGTQLRTAMQQSGLELSSDDANTVASLLQRIRDGSLLGQLNTNGRILSAITDAVNTLSSGPVISGARQQMAQTLGALNTALGNRAALGSSQDVLSFLANNKDLLRSTLSDGLGGYQDLVRASGGVVQQMLKRQADRMTAAAAALESAVHTTIGGLGKVKQGPIRGRLQALLTKQLGNLNGLRSSAGSLGTDIAPILADQFQSFVAQLQPVQGLLTTPTTSQPSGAGAITNILNRVSSALANSPQQPLATPWLQGLQWFQSQLQGLKTPLLLNPVPISLDGSLLKALAARDPTAPQLLAQQRNTAGVPALEQLQLVQAIQGFENNLTQALQKQPTAASGGP